MRTAIFIAGVSVSMAACLASAPEAGSLAGARTSDHFDGKRFFNREPEPRYSLEDRLRWLGSTRAVEWPDWIDDPKFPPPPAQVGPCALRVTYINHATMLIQLDGVNILTDPVWSERASPLSWLGPKRVRAAGIALERLPRIDVVLVSHDHYDHLDLRTLQQLAQRHRPAILVGVGMGRLLAEHDIGSVTEMDWWQERDGLPNGLKVTFVPARHGSGRGVFDRNTTLWGGFVVTASAGRVYFAGDTGYGESLEEISRRFAPFRLAILPVGHYEPRWMMQPVHLSPDDAVRVHRLMKANRSVGMHFGTFHGFGGHNNEEVDQHEADLKVALERHSVAASDFWLLGFGEGRDVPPLP